MQVLQIHIYQYRLGFNLTCKVSPGKSLGTRTQSRISATSTLSLRLGVDKFGATEGSGRCPPSSEIDNTLNEMPHSDLNVSEQPNCSQVAVDQSPAMHS